MTDSERDPNDAEAVIERTAAEDPLAKFVQNRWREIAAIIFVVFAIVYGKEAFEQTKRAALERSADVLLQLQTDFAEYAQANRSAEMSEDEKKQLADLQGKISEYVKTLSQERSPYSELSTLYSMTIGEGGTVDGGLEQNPVFGEAAKFLQAQKLTKDPSTQEQGLAVLKDLVTSGEYTSAPSLVLMARLIEGMENGAESFDLEALAKELSKRQPEQRDLLMQELPELF